MKNNDITEILARYIWLENCLDTLLILKEKTGIWKRVPAAFNYSFIFCSSRIMCVYKKQWV